MEFCTQLHTAANMPELSEGGITSRDESGTALTAPGERSVFTYMLMSIG